MNLVSIYIKICISVLLLLLCWGLVAPILVSSEADLGVLLGIVVALSAPIGVYFILKSLIIKPSKKRKKMKKYFGIMLLFAVVAMSCGRVDPGYVGVKVKMLGQSKGVEPEALPVGRFWMGIVYELYTYPTFTSIYPFTLDNTEGSETDEAFRFQSIEGITCNVDIAISCHADESKATTVFQTYRKEMIDIIKMYIRQDVNNYFVDYASKLRVDELYSSKKMDMLKYAKDQLMNKVTPTGIIIDDISFKSDIRFPAEVQAAIIAKIGAIQLATQKQNEIVQAEADAKKAVAKAEGEYQAKLLEAKGNIALSNSISAALVQYELAKRWNGVSPIYSGNGSVLPPLMK